MKLKGKKGQSADCAAINKLHVATLFLYLPSFPSVFYPAKQEYSKGTSKVNSGFFIGQFNTFMRPHVHRQTHSCHVQIFPFTKPLYLMFSFCYFCVILVMIV